MNAPTLSPDLPTVEGLLALISSYSCQITAGSDAMDDLDRQWEAIRDYATRLAASRAGAAVPPDPSALDAFIKALQAYADNEYCLSVSMAHCEDLCLGWEHKVKTGKFGPAEKDAHEKMDRHLGAHYGIYEAIKSARAALSAATGSPPADTGNSDQKDAARYRWLRQEHERVDPVCHLTWKQNHDRNSSEWVNTAILDSSVDAAMSASTTQTQEPSND